MRSKEIIKTIEGLLLAADYIKSEPNIYVSNLAFRFDSVYLGVGTISDIVLVLNSDNQSASGIKSSLQSFSEALDYARSRRPFTVIIVGKKIDSNTLTEIGYLGRIIQTCDPDVEGNIHSIKKQISILLPLELRAVREYSVDIQEELLSELSNIKSRRLVEQFLSASEFGVERVEGLLRNVISEEIDVSLARTIRRGPLR